MGGSSTSGAPAPAHRASMLSPEESVTMRVSRGAARQADGERGALLIAHVVQDLPLGEGGRGASPGGWPRTRCPGCGCAQHELGEPLAALCLLHPSFGHLQPQARVRGRARAGAWGRRMARGPLPRRVRSVQTRFSQRARIRHAPLWTRLRACGSEPPFVTGVHGPRLRDHRRHLHPRRRRRPRQPHDGSNTCCTAAIARATSASLVCQLHTEIRMQRLPRQVVPPKNASPVRNIRSMTASVRLA